MKKILAFYICTISLLNVNGQKLTPLVVGQIIPSSVWKIIPKKKTTKVIILDFWATSCSSCIEAFPRLIELQKQFDSEVQIVMVDKNESETKVLSVFAAVNKNRSDKNKISLPHFPKIYENNELSQLFPYIFIPHHVWINKNGKVLAITHGENTISENLRLAIKGIPIDLPFKNDKLALDLSDSGFIELRYKSKINAYYSSLMRYDPNAGETYIRILKDTNDKFIRVTLRGYDVPSLYYTAFQHKQRRRIINEVADKEIFSRPIIALEWQKKYCFSYEAKMPLQREADWFIYMQEDINRYLGDLLNVEGKNEKRKFKSLILVKVNEKLLESSGKAELQSTSASEINMVNQQFKDLVSNLYDLTGMEDMTIGRPFIDETGIDKKLKIDITILGNLKDIQNVRAQLQKYGLDIIEAEREVEVLVIKNKK